MTYITSDALLFFPIRSPGKGLKFGKKVLPHLQELYCSFHKNLKVFRN